MKHLLSRLILAFAFIAGTFHAPAIAHEAPASHHADHRATSAHESMADHHGHAPSAPDGTGDSLHHHHCPTALDTRENDLGFGTMSGKALLSSDLATVLTSFSQAPPTEPPAA